MWLSILLALGFLHSVTASWSTLYSFEDGRVYMRLKDNNLVALNISLYGSSLQSQTLNQNTQVEILPLAPANSSLFVYNSGLYAFAANSLSPVANGCSAGTFQLYSLNSTSSTWVLLPPLSYSAVLDESYYQDASYFVAPGSSSIYIYGGRCSSGAISDRLLSFNMESLTFFNVTTPTRPQAFYGAGSLWAPNSQSLVIIGGRSPVGWLNMYQLPTWNFQSGWLFQEAQQVNKTVVDSRVSPLVLPIFAPSSATTSQSFLSSYAPTGALIIGGQSESPLDFFWAKLSLGNQKWAWSTLLPSIDELTLLGGFVVFETFVAVNSTMKRDGGYSLNLYDLGENFRPITELKNSSVLQSNKGKPGTSKTVKILIGVLVPLAVLAIAIAVAMCLWRRKVSTHEHESIIEATDYQFGHFRNALDQPYSLLGRRPLDLYVPTNDSASTLDSNSIDLWVRKRQEYEANRNPGGFRHSYLASNDTLNTSSEGNTFEDRIDEKESLSRQEKVSSHSSEFKSPALSPVHFLESVMKRYLEEKQTPQHRLSLFKTHLFTNTPPGLPIKKKSVLDPGHYEFEELTDCESLDTNMEVQVLVSSKRKSILRVVNPDQETGENIRQRQPS